MADTNKNMKDQNDDKKYPGYPHYPKEEDVTEPDNNSGKVNADIEDISLPDVADIPGQENITPPPAGALADTTASSADEEDIVNGDSLDADKDDTRIVMGTEADVTEEDLELLGDKDKDMDMGEDEEIAMEGLDDTDMDGTPLNEAAVDTDSTGDDLDIDKDDTARRQEDIGEEDEENDYYSLGGDNHEDLERDES